MVWLIHEYIVMVKMLKNKNVPIRPGQNNLEDTVGTVDTSVPMRTLK